MAKRLCFFLMLSLAWAGAVAQGAEKDKTFAKTKEGETLPMVIKSSTLEVNDALRIVTFTGQVEAKKDDFTILCSKMLVYYEKLPARNEGGDPGTKIDKIVASGDVRISRTQGGVATGEEAVYYQADEKLVLTGHPVVKQGSDFVEGDRITIFLKENRSVVESVKNNKVKATIFPRTVQRSQ